MSWLNLKRRPRHTVVGNRIFDIRSAKVVATANIQKFANGKPYTDSETVYLTRKGSWIIVQNTKVIELSPSEVFSWLCRNNKVKALKTYFPAHIEEA